MTTATLPLPPRKRPANDGRVVIVGVDWPDYKRIADAISSRQVHVTYTEGVLEIMTVSAEHGAAKHRVALLCEDFAFERGVPYVGLGSTTFRDERLRKAAEPDECYYFANNGKVRGRKRIDLRRDPPPDLVIEVNISYHEVDRERIYADLGVPELWRCDGRSVEALHLRRGQWVSATHSLSLPGLRVADLGRFLRMRADDLTVRRAFRDWIRSRS